MKYIYIILLSLFCSTLIISLYFLKDKKSPKIIISKAVKEDETGTKFDVEKLNTENGQLEKTDSFAPLPKSFYEIKPPEEK